MRAIAAEPFPFDFDRESLALVVIDMQRDFVEPGGFGESLGNDVSPLRAIVPAVRRLLDGFRAAGLPVVHTRECHRPDLSDCPRSKRERGAPTLAIGDEGPMGRILVAGEPGAEIVPELAPAPGEIVVDKPGKGAFYATDLEPHLARLGSRSLVFAGVTTEVCVQSTMREANDRGFECLLATDATASYFPAFKQAAIEMIRAQGAIVGWTATADAVLEALSDHAAPSIENVRSKSPPPAGGRDSVGDRTMNRWSMPRRFGLCGARPSMAEPLAIHGLLAGGWRGFAFEPFRAGIEICRLVDGEPAVALLRYAPGASVPGHRHVGLETICVLEGSQSDERGRYGAGCWVMNPPGFVHSVWSDDGCVVLVQWAKPVEFVEQGR